MKIIYIIVILLFFIIYYNIKKRKKKYFLAIVAIFKNENDYLDEWIKFHIQQGIDHFYLYDNNDDAGLNVDTSEILNKYNNKITHIIWNNIDSNELYTVQRQAYQNCVNEYRNEFQWIAIVDIDEFLYSNNGDDVKNIIKKYTNNNTPSIRVPRYNYGDSFFMEKPEEGVVNNFVYRERNFSSYKAINNVNYIDLRSHTYGVHRYLYTNDYGTINYNIKINNTIEKNSYIPLVMNHYYTKSYREYINRCLIWNKQNLINYIGIRNDCFDYNDYIKKNKNEVLDTTAKLIFSNNLSFLD